MFLNPPGPDITIEESLRMGGRHTMVRSIAGVTSVTTILITRLDPEPPIYQVTHVAFTEERRGQRVFTNQSTEHFEDLDAALAYMVRAHHGEE